VLFDSSWEVEIAKFLDNKNIPWERPLNSIPWTDKNNIKRKYFPDFYLPCLNIYLDPKNHIVIKRQQEKVDYFSKLPNFIIGDPMEIMARLAGLEPACVQINLSIRS
jgi:hypothetical protein